MILYKYMSLEAAKAVIDNQSIGFSCIEDLNDPFECTSFGFTDNHESEAIGHIAASACRNRFSRKYGVLSLTRQPLNSLMWSHYGDAHQGVVIGFDVDLAGFSNGNTCFIPSQYGEVIYSATKPHKNLPTINTETLMSIGENLPFNSDAFNLAKRAFLFKSIEWNYEEEVRVVKDISKLSFTYHTGMGRHNEWTKITVAGRPLYCFDIPATSIKEIYLGVHIYKNVTKKKTYTDQELKDILLFWGEKDIILMQCRPNINSWQLIAEPSINQSQKSFVKPY